MSKGITITEECHIVPLVGPVDLEGPDGFTEYVHMGDYAHATFVVMGGVIANEITVTLAACDDDQGGNPVALDFKFAHERTGSSDVFSALAWVGGTGGVATGTVDGSTHVVEIDASQLPAGKPWIRISGSDPSGSHFASVVAILSGSRYAGTVTPSAT